MHSLRKTADADPATTFIGIPTSLPIFVSPAAAAGLGNPEGELSITRGAGKSGIIQCVRQFDVHHRTRSSNIICWQLSNMATCSPEEVGAQRQPNQPVIFQVG